MRYKYFDNCATTIMDDEVITAMERAYKEDFFNPSSLYGVSSEIKIRMSEARQKVADMLMCESDEIVFTGSGTESDNLAILGGLSGKKGKIISSQAEHPAVYNTLNELKAKGYEVVYAPLNGDGSVNADRFVNLLDETVVMVVLMHVNNETGAVSDIKYLCQKAKQINRNCIFVCDGIQAFGKIPVNVKDLGVDFYAVSAHKIHGPKGIGALCIKSGTKISPITFGGGQERKLRPGTENVAAIYAFGKACELANGLLKENTQKFSRFKTILADFLSQNVTDFFLIAERSAPPIVALAFADIKSQIALHMLEEKGFYVGNGSACSSKSIFSRVGVAVNLPKRYLEGIVRVCFCKYNSEADVIGLAQNLSETVKVIRAVMKGNK